MFPASVTVAKPYHRLKCQQIYAIVYSGQLRLHEIYLLCMLVVCAIT